jgi:hypothetical protein
VVVRVVVAMVVMWHECKGKKLRTTPTSHLQASGGVGAVRVVVVAFKFTRSLFVNKYLVEPKKKHLFASRASVRHSLSLAEVAAGGHVVVQSMSIPV